MMRNMIPKSTASAEPEQDRASGSEGGQKLVGCPSTDDNFGREASNVSSLVSEPPTGSNSLLQGRVLGNGTLADEADSATISSSSSGFHSAHEEQPLGTDQHGEGRNAESDDDDDDGDTDDEHDDEPSRSTVTTAGGDEASQYIDIDDVLNFLSPSPRKLPVMLKRKGNQTTVVNVPPNVSSDTNVPVDSLSENQGRRGPAGRDDNAVRHASDLSRFVVDVEGSSRLSDDLSGPTFQLVDCDDSVDTISSHRRCDGDDVAADDGDNAFEARDGSSNSPALSIHKKLASSECGGDVVTTAPPSPDGPDYSENNWEVTIQGSRLREHEEEEPTPVASNRAVTVIHPGAILADLDKLSAPLIAIEDEDGDECDDIESMCDNADDQSRAGLQDRAHQNVEEDSEQHLSFDTNLSDSRNVQLDETHASSALELALALLEDEDDEEDAGSGLGSLDEGGSTSSLGRHDVGEGMGDADADEAADRSAYDEALSLLASDSGEVETLFHERAVDDAADSLTRPVDHSIDGAASERVSSPPTNRIMSQDSENDTADERTVKSCPQHESSDGNVRVDVQESLNPLPWMVRLKRLKDASVATMGTAARAIGPRLVDDAICIADSFRDADQLPNYKTSTAPIDSSHPVKPPDVSVDAIEPTIERFATAASSTFRSAMRSSTVVVSDAREFVEYLTDAKEPTPASAVSPTFAQRPSCESSSGHVRTTDLASFGSHLPGIASTASAIACATNKELLGADSTTQDIVDESLSRFASAVSSTASSFVEVSRPVLNDAKDFALILAPSGKMNPKSRIGECLQTRKQMAELDCTPASKATTTDFSSRSLRRFTEATLSAASTAVLVGTPAVLDARNLAVNIISGPSDPSSLRQTNDVPGAESLQAHSGESNVSSAMARLASATSSAVVDSQKSWPSIVGDAGESIGTLVKELRVLGESRSRNSGMVAHSMTLLADRDDSAASDPPSFYFPGHRSSVSIEEQIGRTGASAVFRRTSDADARIPNADSRNMNSTPADEFQTNVARSQQRRPPLFPKKSPYDKGSEKRFVEMVGSKLSSRSLSEAVAASSTGEPDSLRNEHRSFNAKQSVFAEYSDELVSPPGSPPVPSTPSDLNDDDSLSLDGSGSIVEMPPVAQGSSSVKPNNSATILKASARAKSPLQLSQGSIDWGMGSFSSVKSELGVSTRHSASSSKRRGPGRRFSLSSRGSAHGSHHGRNAVNPGQQSYRLEPRAIPHSLSEDALFVDTSFHDDRSETVSTGVQSSSPELVTRDDKALSLGQRHASTPDLQLLGRNASSVTRERRASLTPTLHSRRRLDRSVLSPDSPRDFSTLKGDVGGLRTMFLPLQEEALLEEALMKFSSFTSLDFSFVHDPVEECADTDLTWKQMLACWKHRNVSESLRRSPNARWDHDTVSEPDSSCISHPFTDVGDLRLRGVSLDELSPEYDPGFSYLSTLNVKIIDGIEPRVRLRHEVLERESTASALAKRAATRRQKFTSLVEAIVNDALRLDGDMPSAYSSRGWYSCGLKEPEAIDRKAQRTYSGDVLQVKDILRARIIFPDEGSLVTGLVLLTRLAEKTTSEAFRFTIVRVKNAFAGHEPLLQLPTGYRHILVNIRLNDGLLAEIQFNLAPYFDVLGEDGYRLHQELSSRTAEQSRRAEAVVHAVLQQQSRGDCCIDSSVNTDETVTGAATSTVEPPNSDLMQGESQRVVEIRPKVPALSDPCSDPASSSSQEIAEVESILRLLVHGVQATALNPREIPSLICVHGLLLHLMESAHDRLLTQPHGSRFDKEAIIAHASRCILRSLAISSQASSLGMTGWLEYGSSAPSNRSVKLPFDLLYDLAACHAYRGRWKGVVDALQATVAWCDEHEPPCHPRTLVALLDLSASLLIVGMPSFSTGMLTLFRRQCSNHLVALEAACFELLNDQVLDGWKVIPTFRLENGPSPFSALESFCQTLHDLLNRRFASILGPQHPVIAHHRIALGDAFSVLANCTSAAEALHGSDPDPRSDTLGYWRMALDQYSVVFYGEDCSRSIAVTVTSWYALAHRMARCLYELGNRGEALELLTTALADDPSTSILNPSGSGPLDGNESASGVPTFVPAANVPTHPPPRAELCLARASCHWLAAILSTEVSVPPGSFEGWTRAMSCLRSASHWYQSALQLLPPDAMAARHECLSQLETVEEEARMLLALRDGPPSPHHHYHHHHPAALTSRGTMALGRPMAWTFSHGSNASAL